FGIILVVLLHASNEYYTAIQQTALESPVYWWTSTIYKSFALPCVPLFVILSGALLLQPSKTNEPIRVFLKKRFNRIGLAFLFWSAVYLVWAFLVTQTPVTFNNVIEGALYSLFSGSYYHFWFLYLIAGLYLLTPILRKIVSVKDPKILKYLILLWFVGLLRYLSGLAVWCKVLCLRVMLLCVESCFLGCGRAFMCLRKVFFGSFFYNRPYFRRHYSAFLVNVERQKEA
ncbi:MAG TPA: hypothetical protein ENN36_08940, partial [Candidatus Bathyarchaeota archaeon]|nr:hypothetical protein [Candidatus Bathyarchaeota archaeon]